MADKAILIIDSHSETSDDIVSILESEDYLVFMASTAEFAVAMAKKVKPAVILINPAMADASGLEICKTIHETEGLGAVPFIALSSLTGEMDPRYRSEYGIVELLRTPFTREELLAKTVSVLSVASLDEGSRAPKGKEAPDMTGPGSESTDRAGDAGDKGSGADRIIVRLREKKEGEKEERVAAPHEEPEPSDEPLKEKTLFSDDMPSAVKRPLRRRRSSRSDLTVPVIAVGLLVILGAAGVFVYKMGFLESRDAEKPQAARSLPHVQQQGAQGTPAPIQVPPQTAPEERLPSPASPAPPPSPASPPPPERTPVKRTAGKDLYAVQVGAFRNEKNAEALAKQFREKGYDAFTAPVQRNGETLHRVLVGKFESRKEAAKIAEDIRNKENITVIVTED